MEEEKTFETSDLPLTAFLIMRGLTLIVAKKIGNNKFTFIIKDEEVLHIRLTDKLTNYKNTSIRVYNSKGQYLTELRPDSRGEINWQPEKNLAAGVYLFRLLKDKRILTTHHLNIVR